MPGRSQVAAAAFAFLLTTTGAAAAGIRVDEPAPARPPRIPLPADYRRSSSLQVVGGACAVSALDFAGGGFTGGVEYERMRTPQSSWIVRVSRATGEDLQYRFLRTDDLRDGRIRDIRSARVDAVEFGLRGSSHGASAFYVEADAGISRTRLDGVAVFSLPRLEWVLEKRVAVQPIAGVGLGHVWQPARFPLGLLTEFGWRTRGAPLAGSELSARIGLLGQGAPSSD